MSCFARTLLVILSLFTVVSAFAQESTSSKTATDEFAIINEQIGNRKYWKDQRIQTQHFNKQALILETDMTPVDVILRRTTALLEDIQKMKKAPSLETESKELARLSKSAAGWYERASAERQINTELLEAKKLLEKSRRDAVQRVRHVKGKLDRARSHIGHAERYKVRVEQDLMTAKEKNDTAAVAKKEAILEKAVSRLETARKKLPEAEAALKLAEAEHNPVIEKSDAEIKALSAEAEKKLKASGGGFPLEDQRELFEEVRMVRRQIAFKNPLIDFKDIVFLKHSKARANHMCDQYFGHANSKGGGVFVLRNAFGDDPYAENLLEESIIENGRRKGQKLDSGSFISLDLDYDAKTILFARTGFEGKGRSSNSVFHVYKCNVDGSGLVQLTDGAWNDFDPCFMPNGRIVFISERIGGFGRCHGRPVPTFTLHTMRADGSDIIPISWHETNEWHPSIDNNGMIIYTRWDYVDRDSNAAHHLWHTFPDGRDPRSYHGNYPDRRNDRPWMEMSCRSIPDSHLYISTAAPHHGQAYGSLVTIDTRIEDDRKMSQVKRVTPDVLFPESERGKQTYGTPWPLSKDYYLCVYDPKGRHYGIYLLDAFGNKILLYNDPTIACLDPIPFKPRKRPPVIPSRTIMAEEDRKDPKADMSYGTVQVMNVYEGEFPMPEGVKIRELRIVNIFPKATPRVNDPNVGCANQTLARGVLGTVPVDDDGSVHFKMPTGISVYFQALDESGIAVQTMRSSTYVHPGETLACIGCHERKSSTPKAGRKLPTAMKRAPSEIKPEAVGSYPLSFPRLVQPVLDKKCVGCHEKNRDKKAPSLQGDKFTKKEGWSEAFNTLRGMAWRKHGGNGAIGTNRGSYSVPGKVGARESKLYKHLTKKGGHHDLELTPEEMRRITLWLDCNSNFYGAYFETEKQAKGEIVKPKFGLPPWIDFEKLVK
jgi:hypothetical protein